MRLQEKTFVKTLLVATMLATGMVMAGCSAGGATPGTSSTGTGSGGSTATATTVSLALSSTTVTSSAPATVTATVLDSTGKGVAGAVVDFTVNAAVGDLSASAALTDSNGVASVTLSPAASTTTGADSVVASVTSGSTTVTATRGYQLSATTAAFSSFASSVGATAAEPLSAYGQSVLTINMTGVSPTAPVTLTLTSACVSAGKATISPATTTNSSGTATFTYKDTGGCGSTVSTDTVTASVTGSTSSTTTQVFLTSPTANSITFSSASPSTIFLKGSGNVESSTVKFEVVDTAGNPLPGQQVTLNLSTFAGGLLLDQGTSSVVQTSDSNGFVSAIVNSGTVPTPVRVIATLPSGVTTVSSDLAVVTGLPSQLNFSLSQSSVNIEGADYDGRPNTYTVFAADRSGNPVPDGTSILFWAEGGQIQGSTTTAVSSGVASATASFVSASPRPSDERVTILAYAIGEESFVDLAGTNVFQTGDPFQDLGNVVKSKLNDGIYDATNDEVVSLSGLGATSSGSACVNFSSTYPQFALNVGIPNQPGTCDGAWSGKTYVRRSVETVFSSVKPNPIVDPSLLSSSCTPMSILLAPPTLVTPVSVFPILTNPTLYVGAGTTGSFSIIASDSNIVRLNPMAVGTLITASANNSATLSAASVSVTGGTFTYPSTSNAQGVPITYTFATVTDPVTLATSIATSGTLTIQFVSKPSNVSSAIPVTIVRSAPPSTCQ